MKPMKNKWYAILLVLLMAVILPATRPAFAQVENPCTPAQKEKIRQDLTNALKTSFNNFTSAVGPYNSLAQTYMNNCLGEGENPGPKVRPSVDDAAVAKAAGVDIEDASLYEYISIPWGSVRGDTTACVQLLQQVKAAYTPAVNAYNDMRTQIQSLKNLGSTECVCNESGTDYKCYGINENTGEETGGGGKCEAFTGIMQRLSACPLCGVFEAALNASARVAHVAWQSTAKPLSEVVIIFFLVLLAVESLKAIGSTSGVKLGSYLKSVFLIGLKAAITVTLLSNSQYIYALFISPVIKGGLDMGLAIASASGNIQCDTNPGGYGIIASSELDESLFNQVLHTVRCFGASAATLPAVGMGLICHSAPSGTWGGDFLPDFHMFLSGLIMMGFGLMIWLALSFYLIDCTVQIGMLSALVPLLVACWPFDLTKQYTTKGVKMLMNTFFNFALMGTVLLVGTAIISFAVSGEGSSSMQDLLRAVNNNEADTLKKLASLDGMRVLMLLACCIFALKLIAKASSLAQQFSQGSGADTGSKMAGAALGIATVAGRGGLHSAGKLGRYAGDALVENSGLGAKFNAFTDKVSDAKHSGLAALGQKIGLGKFQNQQTGSGITNPNGDTPPSGGGTPPSGGAPADADMMTSDTDTSLENMLLNGDTPPNDGTPPSDGSTPAGGATATDERSTPHSGREASPQNSAAPSRAAMSPMADNEAAPADDSAPSDATDADAAPAETEADESAAQPQNSNGAPQPQQKPDEQNNTQPKAATRQHNETGEGTSRSRVTANTNPAHEEELRTESAAPSANDSGNPSAQSAAPEKDNMPKEQPTDKPEATANQSQPKPNDNNRSEARPAAQQSAKPQNQPTESAGEQQADKPKNATARPQPQPDKPKA